MTTRPERTHALPTAPNDTRRIGLQRPRKIDLAGLKGGNQPE